MSTRRVRRALLALFAATALAPAAVRAQSKVARLLSEARSQIDELNGDSAFVLLQQALDARAGASEAERVRGFTLVGITELMRGNRPAARQAFEQALRLDGALRIDSLADLQSDALVVFAEARAVVPVVAPAALVVLSVSADLPADTTIPVEGGRLRIETRPSYRSRVVATITDADAPRLILWSDTQSVGGVGTRAWSLRSREGTLVSPGRYALRVTATDSVGQVSQTIERILLVSRVPVDTTPHPPPLTAAAFAPETVRLRLGSPAGLLAGALFGAAAALLPSSVGRTELNTGLASDQTAYAVAGAVTLAGVVGFLGGHRIRALPENIQRNREFREWDAANRARIAQANARAREAASVRVRVEGLAR